MNYADIKYIDVANGPGIRVSLFVSGCTHHCKNCFNAATWDFNYGELFTEKQIEEILEYLKPSHIKGLSLLGGEPLEYTNQQGILPLVRRVEKDVKEKMLVKWPETRELISYIDILVDGKFVEELKNLSLRFRGSSNQRIIDVKKSMEGDEIVLWEEKGTI